MVTIQNIKDYAKTNNIKFEENFASSDIITMKTNYYEIGVELEKHIWYWFICYDYMVEDNEELYFSHRYNMTNGAKQSSFKKGLKAEQIILNN